LYSIEGGRNVPFFVSLFFRIFDIMTGAQFWTYLQQKIDKAYSAYLDNAKANALIAESMQRLVDKYWRKESLEVDADEMIPFLVKAQSVTPVAGVVKTSTLLPNYMHIMYMTANYEESFTVTAVSGTTLTAANHTLRKGDTVKFSSTSYLVTKVKGDTFDLGTGGLTTGTYKRVLVRNVKQMQSDRKGSPFHKATIITPRFEPQTDGTSTPKSFKISPSTDLVTISVDYIRTAPLVIDVANTATTLEDYYVSKFLYRLMDECVLNFGTQTKDSMTRQMAQQDIIENP
jgi:hypothetical protein